MTKIDWLQRDFATGQNPGLLPFILERLSGTITRLESKVKNVSDDILSNNLDGKWSIKQNIGHIADLEVIGLKRVREIEQGMSPMTSGMRPLQQDYNAQPVSEILSYFSKNRSATLTAYTTLPYSSLTKMSLHPRLQIQMSAVDLALFHAEHDDHHLLRINEILLALNS